jgi:hypothetical protein
VSGVSAVFVYDDGTVGLRDLPFDPGPEWRDLRRPPMRWRADPDEAPQKMSIDYIAYPRLGELPDGRAVFGAPRFHLAVLGRSWFASKTMQAEADHRYAEETRDVARKDRAIILAEKLEDIPVPVEMSPEVLEATQMVHRGIRIWCAVPEQQP